MNNNNASGMPANGDLIFFNSYEGKNSNIFQQIHVNLFFKDLEYFTSPYYL